VHQEVHLPPYHLGHRAPCAQPPAGHTWAHPTPHGGRAPWPSLPPCGVSLRARRGRSWVYGPGPFNLPEYKHPALGPWPRTSAKATRPPFCGPVSLAARRPRGYPVLARRKAPRAQQRSRETRGAGSREPALGSQGASGVPAREGTLALPPSRDHLPAGETGRPVGPWPTDLSILPVGKAHGPPRGGPFPSGSREPAGGPRSRERGPRAVRGGVPVRGCRSLGPWPREPPCAIRSFIRSCARTRMIRARGP